MFGRSTTRSNRPLAPRSLRFEHCEERQLMAADMALAAPVADTVVAAPAPPSNGIIAILIGLYRTPTTTNNPGANAVTDGTSNTMMGLFRTPTTTNNPGANAATARPASAINVDVWEHAVRSDPGFDFLR